MSSQEASVWLTNLKEGKVRERRMREKERRRKSEWSSEVLESESIRKSREELVPRDFPGFS